MNLFKKIRSIGFLYNNCMLKNVQENYMREKIHIYSKQLFHNIWDVGNVIQYHNYLETTSSGFLPKKHCQVEVQAKYFLTPLSRYKKIS